MSIVGTALLSGVLHVLPARASVPGPTDPPVTTDAPVVTEPVPESTPVVTELTELPGEGSGGSSPREDDVSAWWWVVAAGGAAAAVVGLAASIRRRSRAEMVEQRAAVVCDGARRVLQSVQILEAGGLAGTGYPVASAVLHERLQNTIASPASGRSVKGMGDVEIALGRLDRAVAQSAGVADPMVASSAAELDRATAELERAVVFGVHGRGARTP